MSGNKEKRISAVVQGTAAVEVEMRDVLASWIQDFYSGIPCGDGLVDIGTDKDGNAVGVWNFGTEKEPQYHSGRIKATRKEVAVLEIASHLLAVLDLPDGDKQFEAAYVNLIGGENGTVEGGVEEN